MAILFLCVEHTVALLPFVLPIVLLLLILLLLLLLLLLFTLRVSFAEEGLTRRLLVLPFLLIVFNGERVPLCSSVLPCNAFRVVSDVFSVSVFSGSDDVGDLVSFPLFLIYVLSNASTDITCASSRSHSPISFACYWDRFFFTLSWIFCVSFSFLRYCCYWMLL